MVGICDVSDENEEQVTRHWRKTNPCLKVAKYLAELYSVFCEKELKVIHMIFFQLLGYVAEDISKYSVKVQPDFPPVHSKM